MTHPCSGHASWSENEGLEQSDTCSMKGSLWREGEMLARKDGNSHWGQRVSPAHAREIPSSWRGLHTCPAWPLSSNSSQVCQLVGRSFAKVQKTLIQPFPPVLKRICLAVSRCFMHACPGSRGEVCLGFPPGHLIDSGELQMPDPSC